MKTLQISTKKEANKYISLAKQWVNSHPDGKLIKKSVLLSYTLIAEYLANQDGKTILIIKIKKEKKMSELLKRMKEELKISMKREVEFRKEGTTSGLVYETCIAVKDVVRSIISMFPEIKVKPDYSTDADVISLLKKYISLEKTRELYLQHILSGLTVMDLSSKEVTKLQKEKIAEMGDNLTSLKIQIAQSYLPPEITEEEIISWIKGNIIFSKYKNKMQAMGPIMKQFEGVDGNVVKKILLQMNS